MWEGGDTVIQNLYPEKVLKHGLFDQSFKKAIAMVTGQMHS